MHRSRSRKRFHAIVEGIEPRSKKGMSDTDKTAFQDSVAEAMARGGRRTYRGALALELKLYTSDRTPAHLHTIAKNLLDLLGRPLLPRPGFRNGLLYQDDEQVKILSVSATHGGRTPRVYIEAAGLNSFVDDIALAGDAELQFREREEERWDGEDPIQRLSDSLERYDQLAQRFGSEGVDALLFRERWDAQQYLFRRSSILLYEFHHLFGYRGLGASYLAKAYKSLRRDMAESMRHSGIRIVLNELPSRSGESTEYVSAVEQAVAQFHKKYSWIITPLLVPIAIEVAVKPAPVSRRASSNDLDNVAKNFLIPAVVKEFQPLSDIAWISLAQRSSKTDSHATVRGESKRKLPVSARVGITRYDVVEIPRDQSDDDRGYVIMSIAADPIGYNGIFNRVDSAIEDWREELQESD